MPDLGDIEFFSIQGRTPGNGSSGIDYQLAQLVCPIRVQEWVDLGEPFGEAWVACVLVSANSVDLVESPNITEGSWSAPDPSGATVIQITVNIDNDLLGLTEYSWSLDVNLTFIRYSTGSPESQSQSISTYTFTTEVVPGPPKVVNPTPADTLTDVNLFPTLSWEAGS